MPRRRSLTDEQEQTIYNLWAQRTPIGEIATRVGVHRNTIRTAIDRITADLAGRQLDALHVIRQDALSTYDAVEREAWNRLRDCDPAANVSAAYLSVILQARKQQDRIMGLERLTLDHSMMYIKQVDAALMEPITIPLLEDGGDDD